MAEPTQIEQPQEINRREFLYYVWSASLALSMAGSSGAVLWFAYPRIRAGQFGGEFALTTDGIPPIDAPPQANDNGRFWLVNTPDGLLAIYKVCTHLGCLYKWAAAFNRFECPCHGSKFTREGEWMCGPAPRSLDRFVIRAEDERGNVLAQTHLGNANQDPDAGRPLAIPAGTTILRIDTGSPILGAAHKDICA